MRWNLKEAGCEENTNSLENLKKWEVLISDMWITEQLKAENQMEWVGRMNNIHVCAREIVDKEMIYQ